MFGVGLATQCLTTAFWPRLAQTGSSRFRAFLRFVVVNGTCRTPQGEINARGTAGSFPLDVRGRRSRDRSQHDRKGRRGLGLVDARYLARVAGNALRNSVQELGGR